MTRLTSIPHEAERIALGLASSIRFASSLEAKPPKTTEWIAPRRAPAIDVQVERVVAGVELAAAEPAIEGPARVVEDSVPAPVPVDVLRGRGPEAVGVPHRPRVCLVVDAFRHGLLLLPSCRLAAPER